MMFSLIHEMASYLFDIKFNELNEQLDELSDRLTSCKNTENREKT